MSFKLNEDLGQVWTPDDIADQMVREAFRVTPNAGKVLDPACGPGTFSKAISRCYGKEVYLTCYDVDPRMYQTTYKLHQKLGFKGEVINRDYLLDTSLRNSFDLIIMNPPYIRQEKIGKNNKEKYHDYLSTILCEKIDRRSNLFSLFMLKGLIDLSPNGVLCAIVFDAIKKSIYGRKTLAIFSKYAELISSKGVKAPFENVLIDAEIFLFRKKSKKILFNEKMEVRDLDSNLVPLEDLLETKRGTALPRRAPFLASFGEKYYEYSLPFFIKQANLKGLVIKPDNRIYLPDPKLEEESDYLEWMETRLHKYDLHKRQRLVRAVKGSIAFNYYIRKAPRHLWNKDRIALSDNFYVSETKNNFPVEVAWLLLNSEQYLSKLRAAASNQGSGLLKLQLYEYKSVMLPNWMKLSNEDVEELSVLAKSLIEKDAKYEEVKSVATCFVKKTMGF